MITRMQWNELVHQLQWIRVRKNPPTIIFSEVPIRSFGPIGSGKFSVGIFGYNEDYDYETILTVFNNPSLTDVKKLIKIQRTITIDEELEKIKLTSKQS